VAAVNKGASFRQPEMKTELILYHPKKDLTETPISQSIDTR